MPLVTNVASMPISLELHAESVRRRIQRDGVARFAEIVGEDADPELVVVTLLAILELYKRGMADVVQDDLFGDIVITHLTAEEAARRGIHTEEDE